jgi:hypothetical protein
MRKGNDMTDQWHQRVAIVAGVGPGLGAALVHKLVARSSYGHLRRKASRGRLSQIAAAAWPG